MYTLSVQKEIRTGISAAIRKTRNHQKFFAFPNLQERRAIEFSQHGVARRLDLVCQCAQDVFSAIPLSGTDIPSRKQRKKAELALHGLFLHIFGCIDNIAWLLVIEKHIKRRNGKELASSQIGFGEKCEIVRSTLSPETVKLLNEYKGWFSHLESYRHSLAHRIPLYIPPYCVDPKNEEQYRITQDEYWECVRLGDHVGADLADKKMHLLGHFKPFYVHSYGENAPTMLIHPQTTVDVMTLAMIFDAMRLELARN
jgi:hypothetical protein